MYRKSSCSLAAKKQALHVGFKLGGLTNYTQSPIHACAQKIRLPAPSEIFGWALFRLKANVPLPYNF